MQEFPKRIDCGDFELVKPDVKFDVAIELFNMIDKKFICDNCGYVVSSDAMSDFDVDDFNYCPYCGESTAIPFEQIGE